MELKRGASLENLNWEKMVDVISLADKFCFIAGRMEGCTITSGSDGTHMANSKHYSGSAIDLRVRYFTPSVIQSYALYLTIGLGDDYDVVIEKSHIHVEWDPKDG